MLIAQSNLKLLPAVLVLLWPLCVVFPVAALNHAPRLCQYRDLLQNLTFLDDALDLFDHERAYAH